MPCLSREGQGELGVRIKRVPRGRKCVAYSRMLDSWDCL